MKKSMYKHFLMLAMLGAFMDTNTYNQSSDFKKLSDEEIEEIEKVKQDKLNQLKLKRGLSIFEFGAFKIIALNKRNALKKLAKIKTP